MAGHMYILRSYKPEPGGDVFTALPNEVLVRIFSYLDPNSLLNVRNCCRHFRLITSDPICWPTSLIWEGSNSTNDATRLNSVLRLTKGTLKKISLSCWSFSKCINRIQACLYLDSVIVHNIKCTKLQIEKLLSLPFLSYLHLDQLGKLEKSADFLEIVAASGCRLKTLSFNSDHFFTHVKTWVQLKYNPSDLRVMSTRQIVHSDIKNILALQPSIEHDAYLSIYRFASGSFARVHPTLQFHFAPSPSLAIVQLSESLPLSLTADEPGSKEFSYAAVNSICKDMQCIGFQDICYGLTAIRLCYSDTLPSTLEVIGHSCRNLLYLDISFCSDVLSDMKGLHTVATCCLKLRVLNLDRCEGSLPDLEKLWEVLRSMSNLRALFIPIFFIPKNSEPILMPQLTNLHVGGNPDCFEGELSALSGMPFLEVLKCDFLPPVSLCSGISKVLHTTRKLTHLYLEKIAGKLTLPADPACYQHLQKLFLESSGLAISSTLVNVLVQSKDMRVLVFRVGSISAKNIIELSNSLKLLHFFHIWTATLGGSSRFCANATELAKSLREIAKENGRQLDLKIHVGLNIFGEIERPELFAWFPF